MISKKELKRRLLELRLTPMGLLMESAQSRQEALSIWFESLSDAFSGLTKYSFAVLETEVASIAAARVKQIQIWVDAIKGQYARSALEFVDFSNRWLSPMSVEAKQEMRKERAKWEASLNKLFLEVQEIAKGHAFFLQKNAANLPVQKLFSDLQKISQTTATSFMNGLMNHGSFPFDDEE